MSSTVKVLCTNRSPSLASYKNAVLDETGKVVWLVFGVLSKYTTDTKALLLCAVILEQWEYEMEAWTHWWLLAIEWVNQVTLKMTSLTGQLLRLIPPMCLASLLASSWEVADFQRTEVSLGKKNQ